MIVQHMFVETMLLAQITCRACGQATEASIAASGLLCSTCRVDLTATAQRVDQARATAELRLVAAAEQWDAIYDRATAFDQARYDIMLLRKLDMSASAFTRTYQQALTAGDGLSVLLRAEGRRDVIADEVQRVYDWAEAALDEVEAAR